MNNSFNLKYTFDDVLVRPRYSEVESRDMVDLTMRFNISRLNKVYDFAFPVINASMDTIASPHMAAVIAKYGGLPSFHRNCTYDQQREAIDMFYKLFGKVYPCAIAIGVKNYQEHLKIISPDENIFIIIDVAHGHHINVRKTIEWVRENYPQSPIISGSIATPEAAEDSKKWGADILRLGVGGGSVCKTRKQTGIGVPQLSAIYDVATGVDAYIIADGAIRNPGDAFKAFAAGADMIMIGNMLAGTTAVPADIIEINDKPYVKYRGMASRSAAAEITKRDINDVYDEGYEAFVPYKGETYRILEDIMRGIKSGCSYVGKFKLSEVAAVAEFDIVTANTVKENGHHDVFLSEK